MLKDLPALMIWRMADTVYITQHAHKCQKKPNHLSASFRVSELLGQILDLFDDVGNPHSQFVT